LIYTILDNMNAITLTTNDTTLPRCLKNYQSQQHIA
jgi:hypothetical protein